MIRCRQESLIYPEELTKETLSLFNDIRSVLIAFEIVKKKPFESGVCINYININLENPKMLDYDHFCLTIKESQRVDKKEFETFKECIERG